MHIPHEQFARALHQGLGRPILYARSHDTAAFADLILHACCYNPIYDRQTGVDRAPYLYELITATGAEAYFRSHILAALADPDDEMDEELLFDLALHIAQDGDGTAHTAIHTRFLDNVSSGETIRADQLIALDGNTGLCFVVEQIGAAMERAVDFTESWLPERLLDDLEAAFTDDPSVLYDPRVATFRLAVCGSPAEQRAREEAEARRRQLRDTLTSLTYEEVREAVEAKLFSVMSMSRWAQQATEQELHRAANDLLTVSDPRLLQLLIFIFVERDFPGGHRPLLPLLDRPELLLTFRAALALARFCHPELRTRALALLAQPETFEPGLILLVGNHEPSDYALLTVLAQQQTDDDALHALVWRVHELLTRAPAPEAIELLLTLYERGPCAQCRLKVVTHLVNLGALPAQLAEECRFDANADVRALVADVRG